MVSVNKMVGVAVGLLVGGILFAALLPTAINELATASLDTNNTSSATETIFGLLPLFLVIPALLILVGVFST